MNGRIEQVLSGREENYLLPFFWQHGIGCIIEIDSPCEGVEVLVNGKSAGIQAVPCYRFDLTKLVRPGKNRLTIEIATTLERENYREDDPMTAFLPDKGKPVSKSGLTGPVRLIAC